MMNLRNLLTNEVPFISHYMYNKKAIHCPTGFCYNYNVSFKASESLASLSAAIKLSSPLKTDFSKGYIPVLRKSDIKFSNVKPLDNTLQAIKQCYI